MAEVEEERRRIALVATIAFVFVLVGGAIWLMDVISENRKLDRCLSSGRKTCVEVPQGARGVARPVF